MDRDAIRIAGTNQRAITMAMDAKTGTAHTACTPWQWGGTERSDPERDLSAGPNLIPSGQARPGGSFPRSTAAARLAHDQIAHLTVWIINLTLRETPHPLPLPPNK